jgi:hypothetical protein
MFLMASLSGLAQNQAVPKPPAAPSAAVPYSSVNQLNLLTSQLQQASQAIQADLGKLRIEKWKTDSNTKKQTQGNVESLKRNLQQALPEMIGKLQAAPENLQLTFQLYRNLEALYDVLSSVAESAGAFGNKDEFQSLANDVNSLERSRRDFAERMESLSGSKEAEIARLRTDLQTAQAAAAAAPPKKVIVDDNEPAKKSSTTKKKSTTKKPAPPSTAPATSPAPQPQ